MNLKVACRSMGYTDGGFWRFYERNNDTYPLVMASPKCTPEANSLWACQVRKKEHPLKRGFSFEISHFFRDSPIPTKFPYLKICAREKMTLAFIAGECQHSGDGQNTGKVLTSDGISYLFFIPSFEGLQIFSSPFTYVPADPDGVSLQRESLSRLEFLDILYAGYDGLNKNTTAALYVEGVPPLMNGLRVERSARDGIWFFEPDGPILLANSTIEFNRGHGIAVENALDGRVFINQTNIQANWGDGVWYKQKHAGLSPAENFLGIGIGQPFTGNNGKSIGTLISRQFLAKRKD